MLPEKDWTPVVRAIALWRMFGRTGLTVHSLATLTNTEPEKVLAELMDNDYVYNSNCGDVGSIVWSVRIDRKNSSKEWHITPCFVDKDKRPYLSLAREHLAKWPWPEYAGIWCGEGRTYPIESSGAYDYATHLARYIAGEYSSLDDAYNMCIRGRIT